MLFFNPTQDAGAQLQVCHLENLHGNDPNLNIKVTSSQFSPQAHPNVFPFLISVQRRDATLDIYQPAFGPVAEARPQRPWLGNENQDYQDNEI